VKEARLQLSCDHYLPVDETQIPTGEITSVVYTAFDFTSNRRVGDASTLSMEKNLASTIVSS
jgi:aldose 1-epimerase